MAENRNVTLFSVVDLFESDTRERTVTTAGITNNIPVKTIVEFTTWYNKKVAEGHSNKIVQATAPIGVYNGNKFEIRSRKSDNFTEVLSILDEHLANGETIILLAINSGAAIDPETFDAKTSILVRYSIA